MAYVSAAVSIRSSPFNIMRAAFMRSSGGPG